MQVKRIFAALAAAVLVLSAYVPVAAASKENVMADATYVGNFNISSFNKDWRGKPANPTKLIDGKYGVGPSNTDDNMNGKMKDKYAYHTADGVEDYHGTYLWGITFELDRAYMIDGVSVMTADLSTCDIGNTYPIQWVQRSFHILVSDTGEAGSWQIAHKAQDLHTEYENGEYKYVKPSNSRPMGYFVYTAEFEPVYAKYVMYAATDLSSDAISQSNWINMTELEIYGEETTEREPPATEPPATEPPATEPPVTEPPATEPPVTEPPATEPPATEPPATEPPVTEPPATEPPATEPPVTEPPATEPPATEPPATEPPVTEPPATEPPVTEPPATEPPATEPPATEPPATEPPVTEPPATEPPATEPPVTEPPATEPPVTEPPATEPPVTEPPATEPLATEPPATEPPIEDSFLPIIVAIAAVVVVALAVVAAVLKKRKR